MLIEFINEANALNMFCQRQFDCKINLFVFLFSSIGN